MMKALLRPSRRHQHVSALVAMMISGVALVRSMDTSQLVAGNLASRNSTLHSADLGVQQAAAWIQAQSGTGALNNDAPTNGYYAEAIEEPWTSTSFWAACTACSAVDSANNTVTWVINRVCKVAGSPNAVGNYCSSFNGSAFNGGSYSSDAVNFAGSPKYLYRITVQVVDRRNSASLSQAFVTL
jgi:type IV pilus assembly protein PilX